MPPSEATNQYPVLSGLAAMATICFWRGTFPIEPWKPAVPKLKMPPSRPRSQKPWFDSTGLVTIGRKGTVVGVVGGGVVPGRVVGVVAGGVELGALTGPK